MSRGVFCKLAMSMSSARRLSRRERDSKGVYWAPHRCRVLHLGVNKMRLLKGDVSGELGLFKLVRLLHMHLYPFRLGAAPENHP